MVTSSLGARLLQFDHFDAALATWLEFLELVRRQCNRSSCSHHYQHHDGRMPVIGDRHHVEDFAKATRDLIKAMDTTVQAIRLVAPFKDDRQS
jgi:tRNA A37 threonylcarbamoyltransferase TsaD